MSPAECYVFYIQVDKDKGTFFLLGFVLFCFIRFRFISCFHWLDFISPIIFTPFPWKHLYPRVAHTLRRTLVQPGGSRYSRHPTRVGAQVEAGTAANKVHLTNTALTTSGMLTSCPSRARHVPAQIWQVTVNRTIGAFGKQKRNETRLLEILLTCNLCSLLRRNREKPPALFYLWLEAIEAVLQRSKRSSFFDGKPNQRKILEWQNGKGRGGEKIIENMSKWTISIFLSISVSIERRLEDDGNFHSKTSHRPSFLLLASWFVNILVFNASYCVTRLFADNVLGFFQQSQTESVILRIHVQQDPLS